MAETGAPIRGVIFDFHATLVDERDPAGWVEAAWRHLDPDRLHPDRLDPDRAAELGRHLAVIWEHAAALDPGSLRDLSAARHREVFAAAVALLPGVEPELVEALYAVMADQWVAYDDAVPVLRELRRRGVRVVVLSNIGLDLQPYLSRHLAGLVDGAVLSYQVGVVKPDPKIFVLALDALGVPAVEALMVGDSWRADAGAAALGIRTLLLPRTTGPLHGLDAVLRLIG